MLNMTLKQGGLATAMISKLSTEDAEDLYDELELYDNQSYTIFQVKAVQNNLLVELRNPMYSDLKPDPYYMRGTKELQGVDETETRAKNAFWMQNKDFVRNF